MTYKEQQQIRQQQWFDGMKAKGHTPATVDGREDLDIFVLDDDLHNGPGCETCGWCCCWHCKTIDDIPECSRPAVESRSCRND